MTEEQIREIITKELEEYANKIVTAHLKEIELSLRKLSKEMIVRAMEECNIQIAQDYSTMQTVIKVAFGRF